MMSNQTKRKIGVPKVELSKSKERPSVFDRLGKKKALAASKAEHCRQWSLNGSCVYGKSCKFASTHILISPSKRPTKDGINKDDGKSRLHSAVIARAGRSPDGEYDNWDQNDLEYADTDVLEKRRLQLQRELELQLKMESGRKDKKKRVTSSSSSRSSSSSSGSTSSSNSSTSSSTRHSRKKRKQRSKRNSSSSSSDIPTKKKMSKDSLRKDSKKSVKKDDRGLKKHESVKKKSALKTAINKKVLVPAKKPSGTPPIVKTMPKGYKNKSPMRRDKHRSPSSPALKDKKERERERRRSRSRQKTRSPRRHGSPSKDRIKVIGDRSRPVSPKRRRDHSRERARDHRDRSPERRKDDKERHERKDKVDPLRRRKEPKRDEKRERADVGKGGLKKPSKPMERLLPRPEERMAALAAISNRAHDNDKASTSSKDRPDSRKPDRDRIGKREHSGERDREFDRRYERSRSLERPYPEERFREGSRDNANRSPGFRRFEGSYDTPRGYRDEGRGLGDFVGDPRAEIGFEDRRPPRRDRSWEGRGSMDRERAPFKEWEGEEFRPEWNRDRHWQHHEKQGDWEEKNQKRDGWQKRGGKPRAPAADTAEPRTAAPVKAAASSPATAPVIPIPAPPPDDLSEISDEADDILNMDDGRVEESEEATENATTEENKPSAEPPPDSISQKSESKSEEKVSTKELEQDKSDIDFEEISDGELEEERSRGVSDALGVDWASLVKAARGAAAAATQTNREGGVAPIAISHHLAPEHATPGTHPIASVQTALERRESTLTWLRRERNGRALSARRSLALRRALCRLPPSGSTPPPAPHGASPNLYNAARALHAAAV